jgi:hypothetical protein
LESLYFGGYSIRDGASGGFYRRPNQARTFTGLHIDGYLPEIHTKIQDVSLSAGIKGKWDGWNVDLIHLVKTVLIIPLKIRKYKFEIQFSKFFQSRWIAVFAEYN